MKILLPIALALVTTALSPAHAQIGGSRQLNDLRDEMNARFEATGRGQLDLANQNEQLRAEVAGLRGQVEVLLHEIEQLKQRQRDFYVDLDDRIRAVEGHGGGLAASGPVDPASEAAAYEAALNLLKEGKHAESLAAFQAFIASFPRSEMLPGANFWAGNAALQAREVVTARSFFNTVISNWPNDAIASDAMLGLANSLRLMGEARQSEETLRRILERYPDSSAAQVARQRLSGQ